MLRMTIALAVLTAGWATGAAAQAIPCGEPYVVRRGDTLMRIARRAYGSDDGLATLIAANGGAFARRDPSLIEVGELLAIPCPEPVAAVAPAAEPEAAAIAEPANPTPAVQPIAAPEPEAEARPPTAAVPEAFPATVPVAQAAPHDAAPTPMPAQPAPTQPAPTQPPEIVPAEAPAAPATIQPPVPPRIVRLDGPSAALAASLVSQALTARLGVGNFVIEPAADGAAIFPLVRPDCAPPASDARCDARWSAPLLDQAMVFFTLRGATIPTTPAGLRQCRSATVAAAGAATEGEAMRDDAAACLRAVAEGRADIAAATAPEADAALRALPPDIAALLAEQPTLTARVALRAMADPGDAAAAALIAALDEGMAALRAQGAWFSVVDAALRATE